MCVLSRPLHGQWLRCARPRWQPGAREVRGRGVDEVRGGSVLGQREGARAEGEQVHQLQRVAAALHQLALLLRVGVGVRVRVRVRAGLGFGSGLRDRLRP